MHIYTRTTQGRLRRLLPGGKWQFVALIIIALGFCVAASMYQLPIIYAQGSPTQFLPPSPVAPPAPVGPIDPALKYILEQYELRTPPDIVVFKKPGGCVQYGGVCTDGSQCCNGVPCTSGRCRYN